MRVGIGFDIHRMVPGKKLLLGGVEMPHTHGPLAHSDGDVLLHALVDAILGAAALGDIGEMFPDTDPRYKDADSATFVEQALREVRAKGFEVVSVDSIVMAEQPKIAPHKESICLKIASMLSLEPGCVSVKGKSFEGMGEIGRGEAIAAQVVAVLRESS